MYINIIIKWLVYCESSRSLYKFHGLTRLYPCQASAQYIKLIVTILRYNDILVLNCFDFYVSPFTYIYTYIHTCIHTYKHTTHSMESNSSLAIATFLYFLLKYRRIYDVDIVSAQLLPHQYLYNLQSHLKKHQLNFLIVFSSQIDIETKW